MISALRTAIKTQAVLVSGISASNFFYGQAKDGQTGLYVVAQGLPFEKEWSSESANFYKIPVQFNFYCSVIATLETALAAFEAGFDFCTLSVTGYTFVHCVPTLPYVPAAQVENIWQATLTYLIEISKVRS